MAFEGKTKTITPVTVGLVESKNDITAGDGAKHDILSGKAALATSTTCHIFELLEKRGIPTAYIGRGPSQTSFYTDICDMIPVEVVVRRVATGSYLKRYPEVEDGTRFDKLVVEFFYKTKNRELHGMQLPCDDPLMVWGGNKWNLHLPGKPEAEGFIQPLDDRSLFLTLAHCSVLAERVFMILEAAWQDLGGELWDFKLEFGKKDNTLLVADVIDCDSWRVKWHDLQLSKQGYREGDNLEEVLRIYRIAEGLVRQM